MSPRMRLAWFGAVAFVTIIGLGNLALWIGESIRGPSWWAIDFTIYDAARRAIDGSALYADPKYVYPPVGALLGLPFLVLDRFSSSLVLAAGKLMVAAGCVLWLTRGWRPAHRALAFAGVVTSLPFLHDFMLGNTNVLVVATLVPAVFGRSSPRNGLLVGVASAALGKPLLIPVLLWLAIWRRSTFVGALVAGAVGTAIGVGVFGISSYQDWVTALGQRSSYLSTPFAGNHGVTAIDPAMWAPVAAATTALLVLVLVKGGPRTGLIWVLTSPILLVSYAGTYSALPIALTLPVIGPVAPALALVMVAISPIATTIPLPFYAGAILVAAFSLRQPRTGPASDGLRIGVADESPTPA